MRQAIIYVLGSITLYYTDFYGFVFNTFSQN